MEYKMKSVILLVLVYYVSGQMIPPVERELPARPEKCHASPDFLYRECCIFPPFFTRDVARSCGAIFARTYDDPVNNITGMRRLAITGCDHWYCVLDKYGLIASSGHLDLDKYFSHLDLWAELNPMFTHAISKAKINCKNDYRYFLPLKPCEFYQLHACIRNYVKVNCPVIRPSQECEELKAFYQMCGEYFLRK